MRLLARFNILSAFRDLGFFLRTRGRHEWVAALGALLVTGYVVWALAKDSFAVIQPRIVYVNDWPSTRSDDEIRKEITAASAERHKAEAARRAEYQKLADQLGIDTAPPRR